MRVLAPTKIAVDDVAVDQVHRRRTDEAGDEVVGRAVVDVGRRPELLDAAAVHHHDAIGERHRLDLVVGDVDGRRPDLVMQMLDLRARRNAQLGVEVRQRLVHQEDRGLAHDRARQRDALALAARQLARTADAAGRRARPSTAARRTRSSCVSRATRRTFSGKRMFS